MARLRRMGGAGALSGILGAPMIWLHFSLPKSTARASATLFVVLLCGVGMAHGAFAETTAKDIARVPAALPDERSVHLPDQPGTVPLQEVIRQAHEDAEASRESAQPPEAGQPPHASLPPLSLQDCQAVLAWARDRLRAATPATARRTRQEVESALSQTLDYVKIQDERHSTLAGYRWVPLEMQRVSGTSIDQDVFGDRAMDDVSAISFQTEGGDVRLSSVKALDDDAKPVAEYNLDPPLLLRAGLPRREVFNLYFPSRVAKVLVRYEKVNAQDKPRVILYAGVTGDREYLKQSQFYLRRALEVLRADRLPEACSLVEQASNRIAKYEKRYR